MYEREQVIKIKIGRGIRLLNYMYIRHNVRYNEILSKFLLATFR